MNSYIQVISFLISFIYGIIFYLFTRFNKYMLINKNNVIKLLVTLVFVIDMVILYIYIMYKVNFGMIHPYFVAVVLVGYIFMMFLYDKCSMLIKRCLKKLRLKQSFFCKIIVNEVIREFKLFTSL